MEFVKQKPSNKEMMKELKENLKNIYLSCGIPKDKVNENHSMSGVERYIQEKEAEKEINNLLRGMENE